MRSAVFVALVVAAGCSKHAALEGWRAAKIGSVYESRTVTRMQQPFERVTETTTKQTLRSRSASEAKVKLEMAEGSNATTQDISVPLAAPPPPHDGSRITTSDETCTVPAGTFQCMRTTFELGSKSTQTWTAKQIPVPLRQIVTTENMTITTELVRVSGS